MQLEKYLQSPGTKQIFIALALIGLLYFGLASSSSLFDRDEPRFCRATAEMLETGNWLYPTFNYELRPDKPILIYWLMAVPMKLFGQYAFACRLVSVLALCVNCLLTYVLGKRLFNARVGFAAMLILPTTISMIPVSIAATADSVLVAFMLATLVLYFQPDEKLSFSKTVFLGLVIGGALLEKGPVGLLPILVIVTYHIVAKFRKIQTETHFLKLIIAILIGCGLFLAWAIPANTATDGEFLRLGIGKHVVGRSVKPMEGHGGDFLISLPFYFVVVAFGTFPWNLFLLSSLAYLFKRSDNDKKQRTLLVSWIVPIFVLMTLVATKLPHYIIFIWPAIAIAIACVFEKLWTNDPDQRQSFKHSKFFFNAVNFVMIFGVPAFAFLGPIKGLYVPAFYICAVFIALYIIVAKAHEKKQWNLIIISSFLAFTLLIAIVSLGAMPAVENTKIAPQVAKRIQARGLQDMPVAVYDYREPSINFYLDREITRFDVNDIIEWSSQSQQKAVLISADRVEKIRKEFENFEYNEIFRVYGLDAKMRPIEILYCLPAKDDDEVRN